MALLLFGGALSVMHESGYVLVDDWLRIRASAPTAVLVKKLRAALDALLADKVSSAHNRMHMHGLFPVPTMRGVLSTTRLRSVFCLSGAKLSPAHALHACQSHSDGWHVMETTLREGWPYTYAGWDCDRPCTLEISQSTVM